MVTFSDQIASALLEIKAVLSNPTKPFILEGGRRCPIYFDNRMTISYPRVRELIADAFVDLIRKQYPDVEMIAGVATAGIPHATLVASKLNLPMIYVRTSPKKHGTESLIEGVLPEGKKVVILEDLVSTGNSAPIVVGGVRQGGGEVLGVVTIFTHGFQSIQDNYDKIDCELHTLTDYHALLEMASQAKYFNDEELKQINRWRESPDAY
ncbi:orotate phosphoribosyltransferase [Tumebacillus algifaecis]|uniref:Orotate phosphoribosyltransferase n=1 Tax=Tumebacillus algifaecis TaxID=1214604 RepID=A0A223CWH5_9BACL|nr:orotate phosphoribosyltransferase [Tumebacillus algifaecis]ASS73660.1 orotate phosphoribosyltransferase [Tumebacillus algifaecis]